MEAIAEDRLGKERGEFVTPGSPLALSLAECPAPTEAGWYEDPLGNGKARYFNGGNWTGQLRPLLSRQSKLIGELEFDSGKGIRSPSTFRRGELLRVTLTTDQLVLAPSRVGDTQDTLSLPRTSFISVTIAVGPPKEAKHSFASNAMAFGLAGVAYSALNKNEFEAQRVGLAVVEMVTFDGALILTTNRSMAQSLRDRLAPLAKQAAAQLAAMPPPEAAAATPAPSPAPQPQQMSADDTILLIEKLRKLRDAGTLTDDEFVTKKAELLARL